MKLKKILIAIIVLGVSFVVFLFCFYKYNLTSVSNNKNDKIITIEGGSIASIGKILKENNLIRNELIFKIYVKLNNINNLKASTYKLNESMSLEEIINILKEGNSYNPDEITITFKEGKNMRSIANTISKNTNNTFDDVINKVNDETYVDTLIEKYWFLTDDIKNSKIYYDLEGYLFPNTYAFLNKDVSVETIIETMLDETQKQLEIYKEKIENLNISIHEFFTLASLVELEEANPEARKGVAGVFYNRINDNWSLGSDVTTYYALKIDDYSIRLTEGIGLYKCDKAYNTRCTSFIGLPVGPICNPGIVSLIATLEPENHDYYYFVADCTGTTHFNKDAYGHRTTINKLKSENNLCA